MNLTLQGWLRAVAMTLNTPEEAAERVLENHYARPVLVQAAIVVSIANVMLLAVASMMTPATAQANALQVTPFTLGLLITGSMLILASAISRAGKMLGGTGSFDGALTIVVWLQAVGLTFDVAQILVMLVSPFLAVLVGIGALMVLLWCMVHFVKVLHGFDTLGTAGAAFFIAMIGTIFAVVILMALLGIAPSGEAT
ncbi:Yip1-like protein [Yoonia maritima]|uniref:Yip1-like protein n=1 Tax=Yoonia maritima TaxID=1435347 RepID=A0A2T0W4U0_9RHOB|nr:Yip1 family protein [Yoonia maritima]PRY80486.1 Yip1-like protein [Yoonia maritima]